MENLEYFRIIITGFVKHGRYLKDHIFREYKKAEKDFVSKEEFFNRCRYIIKWIESEFDKPIHERKKEIYWLL